MHTKRLQEILQGYIKGNRRSQEQLYQLYSKKMFAVCLYYTKIPAEAEDILHNGFIKVFEKIKQFKGTGSFEGWMRRIFINEALAKFRKHTFLYMTGDVTECSYKSDDADMVNKLSSDELLVIIRELSPAYRIVFNLYAIEGYSHKEISGMLGITEGTSKSNLARARIILQRKVRRYFQHTDRKIK